MITFDSLSMSPGNLPQSTYTDYITTPASVDVIATSTKGPSSTSPFIQSSTFGQGQVPLFQFQSVRMVLEGMATYSGNDPCTGDPVSASPIELPDMQSSTIYGPNKLLLQYQVPHENIPFPPDTQIIHPFTIAGPAELRLVFPSTNGVICAANLPPLTTISGIAGNPNGLATDGPYTLVTSSKPQITAYDLSQNAIKATISGPTAGLSNPVGIYVDAVDGEIGVANSGNQSVTIYDSDPGNWVGTVSPKYIIIGPSTNLSGPGGIGYYPGTASFGGIPPLIVVANGTNDSVILYNHDRLLTPPSQSPSNTFNINPLYTIQGADTGLHAPCGLYVYVDQINPTNDEIGVANNGNNSVTIYRMADIAGSIGGDVAPVRTIMGTATGLSIPCGLYVYVDQINPTNDEIGVTNTGNNTITFYDRTASGDAPPTRTLRGRVTGLDAPVAVSPGQNDDIVVANLLGGDVTDYPRLFAGTQLLNAPVLNNSVEQQALLAQYYNSYLNATPDFGSPTQVLPQSVTPSQSSPDFDGYAFNWKLTDQKQQFRQVGDAAALGMVPPKNQLFTLTDGTLQSTFNLQCPVLTPFSILDFYTYSNCQSSSPLISAPNPAPSGIYTIPAVILQTTYLNNQLTYASTPLTASQLLQLYPTVRFAPSQNPGGDGDTIQEIDWSYAGEPPAGVPPSPDEMPPLIYTQSVQISLQQPISTYPCNYQQVTGNATNLVYASGALTPELRKLSPVVNPGSNQCGIKLSQVSTIEFVTTDALGNNYLYTWTPNWTPPPQ
ncbi:MAG TPA: hypothetical protein VLY45_05595 [Nitrospiria bacterium]|nr:hypothetical protein [Nitrospiria bacterium]